MDTSKRILLKSKQYCDYHLISKGEPKRLYLLLHGYAERGRRIYRKLEGIIPEDSVILCPNGPFPLPEFNEGKVRIGYAWYFFDRREQKYLINQVVPVDFIMALLKELKLDSLPCTVIGYSQGGYLAPFIGQSHEKVDHVIGINCEFKKSILEDHFPFKLDGIHTKKDEKVPLDHAVERFQELKDAYSFKGELILLENGTHAIDQEIIDTVSKLLS
jgi:predicted esterase